ncbi:hypothetical protein PMIN03_009893 [Paraphaeosphaeria minitans]
MIPPARFRRFIRNLHLYTLLLDDAWEMLSTFRINILFGEIHHLVFSIDCRWTLSDQECSCPRNGKAIYGMRMPRGDCMSCQLPYLDYFLEADIAAVKFEAHKFEVEFIPVFFPNVILKQMSGVAAAQVNAKLEEVEKKVFALIGLANAGAGIEESLYLWVDSRIVKGLSMRSYWGYGPAPCNRRTQKVRG